ncbi:MAG: response regulator [Anaerolineae bacterium]|nr:response regulator [Anaerolineae bacterium]
MLLKGKRVYVIEDEKYNYIVFKVLLEEHGADVVFGGWSKNTLRRIKDAPPDIILLDLMFPNGVSGFDIFTELRQEDALGTVPIIAVSASNASTSMGKARQMGFAGYISKPINFQLFPNQILSVLNGETVWYAD